MASIVIRGKNASGKWRQFARLLSYTFQSDRFTPADCFSFEVLDPLGQERILSIDATFDGKPLFSGMVDTQVTELTDKGQRTAFSCRSRTAELLDNEAKPMVYPQFSTLDLLRLHGHPFGIAGHRLQKNCTFRSIAVAKGMSHWEFICYFCRRAYGRTPFLDRDRKLTLAPFSGRTHRFSNQNGLPFSRAVLTEDRYDMLSTLHVKTGEDDSGTLYNHRVENSIADALGICRERYYHPATLWEDDLKRSARHVLKEQQLGWREFALTIPRFCDARVGEYATFDDPSYRDQSLYVAQVCHEGTAKGHTTTLRLWDRTVV